MDRLVKLRRHIDRNVLGMEVAAYFNPIATKANGYNVMIVDVFDTETLRRHAKTDPFIPDERIDEIEAVDIVSDASALGEAVTMRGLAGQFGYIVSSHNFEHLPDPVRFLQGCAIALKPGGMLTMAIPDCRACFDHFRMPTRLSDWLAAYHRGYTQPSPETHFDYKSNFSLSRREGEESKSCHIDFDDPSSFVLQPMALQDAYVEYLAALNDPGPYRDAHCSVMFGETFELMVRDLIHLGLLDLELVEIMPTHGHEFFVHLRKPVQAVAAQGEPAFRAERERLLRRISQSLGTAGYKRRPRRGAGVRLVLRAMLGQDLTDRLRSWNRARRMARRKARKKTGGR